MIPLNEVAMESRLSLVPAMVEKLRSDPELRSRIDGREAAFCVAISEALANAIIHGNHNDPSRKVYVRCTFEPDALSIAIRDEGSASIKRTLRHQRVWEETNAGNSSYEVMHGRGSVWQSRHRNLYAHE